MLERKNTVLPKSDNILYITKVCSQSAGRK
nr:MAG TPA: hypothetical protein [Caudoviricetes sp.]